MEQAPLISIIMPVYNAGVLLHTAVESVLRQSFADFELLLVDDGSTDGSAALAHELAKKDGRIRVLEQPNAGICAARNLGLQHCRGQWFTFCDDDDTMLPHALETLLVLAKSTGADVVRGGHPGIVNDIFRGAFFCFLPRFQNFLHEECDFAHRLIMRIRHKLVVQF